MEIKLLHDILIAINKEKTISTAAASMYLSQPYVSQIINRAERKYKVKLVNRSSSPVSLTEAGVKCVEDLEVEIRFQEKTKHDLSLYSKQKIKTIRIAISPIWIPSITTKVIQDLQDIFPEIHFEITKYFTASSATQLLKNNQIDIFWGAFLHEIDIESSYLYRSLAYVIIPNNHPLYKSNQLELPYSSVLFAKLNNSDIVALNDNSLYQKIVDHIFEDDGLRVRKVIKTNDFIGAGMLASQGLGITVTLEEVLQYLNLDNANLISLPENLINLDVGLSINKNSSDLVQQIAKNMKKLILQYKTKIALPQKK